MRARWLTIVMLLSGCATSRGKSAADDKSLLLEMAEIMVHHHAYDQAVPILAQAAAAEPNNARVHFMLGTVLRDRGMYDQALGELRVAQQLTPQDVEIVAAMGVLWDMWGQGSVADDWHRKALNMAPQSAALWNNLGFSLYLRRQDDEAAIAFEKALRFDPADHRAFNNLGFVRARQGDADGALRAFLQGGSRAEAFANMALSYELAGNAEAAQPLYEQAANLDSKLSAAKQAARRLAAAHPHHQEVVR